MLQYRPSVITGEWRWLVNDKVSCRGGGIEVNLAKVSRMYKVKDIKNTRKN